MKIRTNVKRVECRSLVHFTQNGQIMKIYASNICILTCPTYIELLQQWFVHLSEVGDPISGL